MSLNNSNENKNGNKIKNFFQKLFNKLKNLFTFKHHKEEEKQEIVVKKTEKPVKQKVVKTKSKRKTNNNQKFYFKKETNEKHKFRNVDPEDLEQLEEIQKTAGDNCDGKLRKEQIKKMRRVNGRLKTHYVGKLSTGAKKFSIYRHAVKKRTFETEQKIAREEREAAPTFYDSMYAKQNPGWEVPRNFKDVKPNLDKQAKQQPKQQVEKQAKKSNQPKERQKDTRPKEKREQHAYTTLNLAAFIEQASADHTK